MLAKPVDRHQEFMWTALRPFETSFLAGAMSEEPQLFCYNRGERSRYRKLTNNIINKPTATSFLWYNGSNIKNWHKKWEVRIDFPGDELSFMNLVT